MLRWIVARRLRAVFRALNEGRTEPMLDALASRFEYRFEGDTPIGGLRRSRASMRRWWDRMYRLFPGLQFDVRQVSVAGWPWAMHADLLLNFTVPHGDGPLYTNVVMQRLRFRGTRVSQVHTLEDTARCSRYLAWRATQGCDEAAASAITDDPWPDDGPFMRIDGAAKATA